MVFAINDQTMGAKPLPVKCVLEPTVPVGNVEQRIPKDDESFMISQCDVQPAVMPSRQRPGSETISTGGEQDRQAFR